MEIGAYKINEIKSILEEQKVIIKSMRLTEEDSKRFSKTIEKLEKAIRPYEEFRDSLSYP